METPLSKKLPKLIHSKSLQNLNKNYCQNRNLYIPLNKILNNDNVSNQTFISNKTNKSSSLPKISNKYDPIRNNKYLNKIYSKNTEWIEKFNKIKKENNIALKKNFNIEDYQNRLFNVFIGNKNSKIGNYDILYKMKKNFSKIQNILEEDKSSIKNNRWKDVSEKLHFILPQHLICKLKNVSM
jgi:hypothetical protein